MRHASGAGFRTVQCSVPWRRSGAQTPRRSGESCYPGRSAPRPIGSTSTRFCSTDVCRRCCLLLRMRPKPGRSSPVRMDRVTLCDTARELGLLPCSPAGIQWAEPEFGTSKFATSQALFWPRSRVAAFQALRGSGAAGETGNRSTGFMRLAGSRRSGAGPY